MTSPYRGVPVLVLGATGFIGRWVAQALVQAGAVVTGAVRRAPSWETSARLVPIDLADPDAVERVWTATRPSIVFNLAGYGIDRSERDEHSAHRINAELVEQLVELSHATASDAWQGARLVHAGSVLEYGRVVGPLHEGSIPNPDTLYGRTKLEGTRAITSDSSRRSVTARLFTVYGPGEHAGRLLPSLLDAVAHDHRVPLSSGVQRRDFTFVGDVVRALLALGAIRGALPPVVHVATGQLTSVRDFVERAATVLGIDAARLGFGMLPTRDDETAHAPPDVTALKGLVGFLPTTSIERGVALSRAGVLELPD